MSRDKHTIQDVIDWLSANHPTLSYEQDRKWIWIVADLKEQKEIRKSIKDYGFIFAKHGGHKLPSGQLGAWGHSCMSPIPFSRKRKDVATTTSAQQIENEETETEEENAEPTKTIDEALAFAMED